MRHTLPVALVGRPVYATRESIVKSVNPAVTSVDPAAAEPAAQRFHIPSLDGLRAVSVLIVFLGHAGIVYVPGQFGVTVFFFLSGYLITTLLRMEDATGKVNLRLFYMRRVLRILPPFYLTLLACTLLGRSGLLPPPPTVESTVSETVPSLSVLLSLVFHYSNYQIAYRGWEGFAAGTGVYWSLAVEEHFYLLFPLLFILLRRARLSAGRMAAVFAAICACILAWRCVLVFGLNAHHHLTYFPTDARADSILYGCVLAVWNNPVLDDSEALRSARWRWIGLPLGLLALLASLPLGAVSQRFAGSFQYSIQGLALFPIFVTAVRYPRWWVYRPLNHPLVRRLGVLSYSFYLCHHVIIELLQRNLSSGPIVRGIVALLLSLVVAELLYRFVEMPFADLRRRLSIRMNQDLPPAPNAVSGFRQ
jgi:peptidoglycan/LPS O-acetylase OafA/YrhL